MKNSTISRFQPQYSIDETADGVRSEGAPAGHHRIAESITDRNGASQPGRNGTEIHHLSATDHAQQKMAERMEEARISLQEETPVVKVIEPAEVPNQRSSPNRPQVMILYTMIGGVLGIGIIFSRKMIQSVQERW